MKTVYHANTIIPMTGEGNIAQYMVTNNDEILFVGNELHGEFKHLKQISFEEKTILPAFLDTHTHYSSMGFCIDTLPLFGADSIEEILQNLREYIRNNPKKIYLLFGFSQHKVKERRLITRKELDTVDAMRPIFISVLDGHGAIANSAVVKETNLKNKAGFYPEEGHYFQDAFYEVFKKLSQNIIPFLKDFLQGLQKAARFAAKQGVTTIVALQGEGIPFNTDLKAVRAYSMISPIRIIPYFQTRDIKAFQRSGLKTWGGCFDCAIDGAPSSFDMALKEPYLVPTDIPGNCGKLFYNPKELDPMIQYAEKHNFQLAIHAIGDWAVEEVLNAFKRNIPKDNPNRHRIEHGIVLDDELIKGLAQYHIHISTQPECAIGSIDPIWLLEKILGKERTWNKFMPLKKMVDAGIEVSGSSDSPVTLVSPIKGIHSAVNHFNPDHRISIYEAIKLYTINGAKGVRMEDKLGSLQAGKIADFVVLDKNPLTTDSKSIKDIKVLHVYSKGKKL